MICAMEKDHECFGVLTTKSGKTLAVVSVILSIVVFALQILIVLGLIAAIGLAGAAGP